MTVRVKTDIVCDQCGFVLEYGRYQTILAPTGTEVRAWAKDNFDWLHLNGQDICSECQDETAMLEAKKKRARKDEQHVD